MGCLAEEGGKGKGWIGVLSLMPRCPKGIQLCKERPKVDGHFVLTHCLDNTGLS